MPTPSQQQDRDTEFLRHMQRIEALVGDIQRIADPAAQTAAQGLVQSLMELHTAAFEKMTRVLHARTRTTGPELLDELAGDDLVGSLLLLHELHPWDTPRRVRLAVDQLRAALEQRGGAIELLHVDDQAARVHLDAGSGGGCGSSSEQSLREAVEQAIRDKAPDLVSVEIESVPAPGSPEKAPGFVQVTVGHDDAPPPENHPDGRPQHSGSPAAR